MILHCPMQKNLKKHPNLPMAVIASEDNRFAEHNGFDLVEIKKAMKENETRKRKRGASTISQQTAKNVFLWPQSSWVLILRANYSVLELESAKETFRLFY